MSLGACSRIHTSAGGLRGREPYPKLCQYHTPVTETFWGGGWPKKGISTMSRSDLWALTAEGHTVQPYQLCDLDKLLSMAKPLFPHL